MSKKLLNLCMTALLSFVATAAWALSEVNGVYQIGTAEDLIAFAELVNGGNPGANAVLTADIDRGTDGTMIGKDGVDYQGTFDGQGHTITINTFSSGADGVALFRNVGARALIQNLKVQGTITTDKKHACGIAAWSRGTIRGCYVDVNVVSAVAGDATHGGIVGVGYQGGMIENCLAKFTIKGATSTNNGGIVGWCSERTNVINCLVINDGSEFQIDGNSGTIGRNDGQLQTVNLTEYIGNEYDKRPGGASTNNYATNAWGNTKCVTIVPYDGGAANKTALMGNHIQLSLNSCADIQSGILAGDHIPLMTVGDRRAAFLPDTPCTKELGYDITTTKPRGLYAPNGMDPAQVKVLADACQKVCENEEFQKKIADLGLEVNFVPGDELKEKVGGWVEDLKPVFEQMAAEGL